MLGDCKLFQLQSGCIYVMTGAIYLVWNACKISICPHVKAGTAAGRICANTWGASSVSLAAPSSSKQTVATEPGASSSAHLVKPERRNALPNIGACTSIAVFAADSGNFCEEMAKNGLQ